MKNKMKEYVEMRELNVMEGIDFKANQKRMNELKNSKSKNKHKKFNNVLYYIILTIAIVLFIVLVYQNYKMGKEALNSCQELGNSYEYCIRHI